METEGASLTNTTGVWSIKVEADDATDEPQVWYVVKQEDDHESEDELRSAESLQDNTPSQGMSVDGTLPQNDWKTEEKYTPHQQPSSVVCMTTVGTKTMYDSEVGAVMPSTEPVTNSERDIIPNNGQLSQNVKTEPIEADMLECGAGTCPETVDSDVTNFEIHTTEMPKFGSSTAHVVLSTPDAWHIEENPLMCEICGIGFKYPSKLRRHTRIHTGERPHTCDICGKTFTEAFKLKNHRYSHLDVKPYTCEVCGKGFSYSSNLYHHKVIHSEERSFSCDICGKSFKLMLTLKRHRGIHTGEKPHVCKVCNKSFTQTSQLKNHIRIHTCEKPFFCEICCQTFTNSYSLNNHKRKHKRKKRQEEDVRRLGEAGQGINAERQAVKVSDLTDKVASCSSHVRAKCQTILSLLLSDSASNLSQKGKVAS
ncbi:putative zinc finger protein 66 [Liolophura sinensis]|uniref:putative zinc finger protein 66 n=1 Tax=Liolophura sinensis TaxID=3198878 RepID=UPI003158C1B3